MEYKDFLTMAETLLGPYSVKNEKIFIYWTVGGMTGGSCWNSGAESPVCAEPEPEFEDLDKLLEAACPSISFLQYKRLCQELIETSTRHKSEYYGNYREEAIKTVRLRNLYDALKDRGLI